MRLFKKILLTAVFAVAATAAYAQNTNTSYKEATQNFLYEYKRFSQQSQEEYSQYREQCNKEYAQFLRQAWSKTPLYTEDTIPQFNGLEPVAYIAEEQSAEIKIQTASGLSVEDLHALDEEVKPIDEFIEIPSINEEVLSFTFYGTDMAVRIPENRPALKSTDENHIADMWEVFSQKEGFNNMVYDCLKIKEERNLCDWAYLKMIQTFARKWYGADTNESTLLTAFIYAQSGYKIKLARNSIDMKLYLLCATKYNISGSQYSLGDGYKYYVIKDHKRTLSAYLLPDNLHVSPASMEKEMPLSMNISKNIRLSMNTVGDKALSGKKYPETEGHVNLNKNLVDFYNDYPYSYLHRVENNWVTYANTPLSEESKKTLYPQLRKAIKGKDTPESLNILLDFVQHAFEYKVDNEVWGEERVFFPEETLHYPYSDCEDRSILFSRIVRDILGLDVVLVYYKNHLATAVNMNRADVPGSYIADKKGNKYIICDATYFGATIGMEQPAVKGAQKYIIQL